jgi:hypothetical protein
MDNCRVLIDDWQMQCCGIPFSVGDSVEWLAKKWVSCDFYIDVGTIDYYYEHHSPEYKKLFKIIGKVAKIQALYCILVPDPAADPTNKAVIKTQGKVYPVTNFADGNEDDIDGQEFDAYVVCLEDIQVAPAKQSEVTFH